MEARDFLGKGPAFPMNRSTSGGFRYSEDIYRINQSLFLLFETPKGDRLMMPEFGSDIHKYKFDPLDTVLMEQIRRTIMKDVQKWESRIDVTEIEFLSTNNDIDNNILYISINYKLINSSVQGNYVYPYQLGTYDTLEISY